MHVGVWPNTGQAGQVSEKPDVSVDVPVHCREFGPDGL